MKKSDSFSNFNYAVRREAIGVLKNQFSCNYWEYELVDWRWCCVMGVHRGKNEARYSCPSKSAAGVSDEKVFQNRGNI